MNAFRPGRPQPRRLLMHHLEHAAGTSDTGDHYDNFEGYGAMWRSRLRRIFGSCAPVEACEQRAREQWGLTAEKLECSAARVFAHVHVLARSFPKPKG